MVPPRVIEKRKPGQSFETRRASHLILIASDPDDVVLSPLVTRASTRLSTSPRYGQVTVRLNAVFAAVPAGTSVKTSTLSPVMVFGRAGNANLAWHASDGHDGRARANVLAESDLALPGGDRSCCHCARAAPRIDNRTGRADLRPVVLALQRGYQQVLRVDPIL